MREMYARHMKHSYPGTLLSYVGFLFNSGNENNRQVGSFVAANIRLLCQHCLARSGVFKTGTFLFLFCCCKTHHVRRLFRNMHPSSQYTSRSFTSSQSSFNSFTKQKTKQKTTYNPTTEISAGVRFFLAAKLCVGIVWHATLLSG